MIEIKLAPIERSIVDELEKSKKPLTPEEIASIRYVEVKDWDGWRKIIDRLADCGFIVKIDGKYGSRNRF